MNLDRLAALAAAIEPTDWTYESDQVWGNDGDLVADVSGVWRNSEWTTDDVVAEYIVRACVAAPALVAFAQAVLALTYARDDGSEFEHSEGCDGQSECGACWAADIRRLAADQHLGGDR